MLGRKPSNYVFSFQSRASQTSTGCSWYGTPQALQAAAMMSDLQLDLSKLLTVKEHTIYDPLHQFYDFIFIKGAFQKHQNQHALDRNHDTKIRYFSCTAPTAMAGKTSSLTKPSVEHSLPKPSQQGPDADCCPVERFYQRARIIHGSKKGRMMCQQATQRKSLMHQKLQTSCITLWPMLLRSCDGNHLTNIVMC